jgi:hypothetical protein
MDRFIGVLLCAVRAPFATAMVENAGLRGRHWINAETAAVAVRRAPFSV